MSKAVFPCAYPAFVCIKSDRCKLSCFNQKSVKSFHMTFNAGTYRNKGVLISDSVSFLFLIGSLFIT